MHKLLITGLSVYLLTGCATQQPELLPVQQNRVVTKTQLQRLPQTQVAATFGYANDPLVAKAYHRFVKTGHMQSIQSSGFRTVAFNQHHRTFLGCSPLHLCVVQLEVGEAINSIELGDSAHWSVNTSLVGTATSGSQQISIKPKEANIATDMIVATNKRTYHFGLISQKGKSSEVVSFYYPEQTLAQAVMHAKLQQSHQAQTVDTSTKVALKEMNFAYSIKGDRHILPCRVFDDGKKTYIEMSDAIGNHSLPVLYLKQANGMALVNYRYQQPYFVVDGLFTQAYLIAGVGKHKQQVLITNQKRV